VVDRRAHCGGGAKPARTCTVRAGGWPLHPLPTSRNPRSCYAASSRPPSRSFGHGARSVSTAVSPPQRVSAARLVATIAASSIVTRATRRGRGGASAARPRGLESLSSVKREPIRGEPRTWLASPGQESGVLGFGATRTPLLGERGLPPRLDLPTLTPERRRGIRGSTAHGWQKVRAVPVPPLARSESRQRNESTAQAFCRHRIVVSSRGEPRRHLHRPPRRRDERGKRAAALRPRSAPAPFFPHLDAALGKCLRVGLSHSFGLLCGLRGDSFAGGP
jgi:hypothetical protein